MQGSSASKVKFFDVYFLLLLILFAVVLIRTAWIGDDALITFRSVLNFVHGYGPNFNLTERVQSYTHPLWFLVLSAVFFFSREIIYTTMFLSIGITLFTILLLGYKLALSKEWAITATIALLLSKAFVDYGTSGLENPLSYLVITVFVLVVYRRADQFTQRDLVMIVFMYSLIALTRLDLILLVTPLLLWVFYKAGNPRGIVLSLLIGGSPLILWMLFSLYYYGFPLPNTAYAKLGAGVSRGVLIEQGAKYFFESLNRDPLTLTVIAFAVLLSLKYRSAIALALVIGIFAYLGYVLMIGGDFMSGRFFAVPLLVAAILLVLLPRITPFMAIPLVATITIIGLLPSTPTIFSDETYSANDEDFLYTISDERGYYYQGYGLLASKELQELDLDWTKAADRAPVLEDVVVMCAFLGNRGLELGQFVHIIDECALADPLLARLSAKKEDWRVGHNFREVPGGYEESVRTSQNVLWDEDLREYYEKIKLLTQSELWSGERFLTIARMNLGAYNDLIDEYLYR